MKNIYVIFILLCAFYACKESPSDSPISLFSASKDLIKVECNFNEDLLALVEGLQCNDLSLVAFDYHSGNSFTLFNLETEEYIGRFGTIGQGPGEIPLGCYGYLDNHNFDISYDHIGLIARYRMDSLHSNIGFKPISLTKYEIPDAAFSRVIPINESIFFGAGTYKSEFQFVIFNNKNKVIDYKIEIFNAKDETFNFYHKYLSNQGILKKHPNQNKFAYAINYSSNIDFIEVSGKKIILIKSIQLRNPKGTPIQDGDLNRVHPDTDSPIGYVDIATSSNGVYTLYTDKKMIGDDGKGNSFSSNIVLKFDWEGNPIQKYKLTDEAYYITVNEKLKKMYAAIKGESGGWKIVSYDL